MCSGTCQMAATTSTGSAATTLGHYGQWHLSGLLCCGGTSIPGSRRAAGCPGPETVGGNAHPDSRRAGCPGCCRGPWPAAPDPDRRPSPPCSPLPLPEKHNQVLAQKDTWDSVGRKSVKTVQSTSVFSILDSFSQGREPHVKKRSASGASSLFCTK